MYQLIATILFISVLVIKLGTNLHKFHSRKPVNHSKEAVYVIAALLPSVFLFSFEIDSVWNITLAVVLLMLFFNFWHLFDGLYNVCRGENWWFNGSKDPDDSKLDRLLMLIPVWLQAVIKVGGSLLFIFLYIKIQLQ